MGVIIPDDSARKKLERNKVVQSLADS